MEQEIEPSEKYVKGFNNGYLLAKHEPALLSEISRTLKSSNEYIEGIFSGKEQYEIEQTRTQQTELEQIRATAKERDNDLIRD